MKTQIAIYFTCLLLISSMQISNAVGATAWKSASGRPQEGQRVAEIDQIQKTLQQYIEGSTNGQPELLKQAFHPDLNLYSIRGGSLNVWSGKNYIQSTEQGRPTGETGKILAIDFENDIAVAKVRIKPSGSNRSYIDYFMLLKIKNKWTIVHKMYTRENEASGMSGVWKTPQAKRQSPVPEKLELEKRRMTPAPQPESPSATTN